MDFHFLGLPRLGQCPKLVEMFMARWFRISVPRPWDRQYRSGMRQGCGRIPQKLFALGMARMVLAERQSCLSHLSVSSVVDPYRTQKTEIK